MTDILGRLRSLGSLAPEMAMELIAMVIDGLGTGTEWSGEQLDQLGELTQQLADKVRGVKGDDKT